MIKLTQLINELGINNPIMPKVYYSKSGDMWKIENTGNLPLLSNYGIGNDMEGNNVENGKDILKEYPNLHYILKCLHYSCNEGDDITDSISCLYIRGTFPSKMAYSYIGEEGSTDITSDLKLWSVGYQTEEENGVKDDWKLITI